MHYRKVMSSSQVVNETKKYIFFINSTLLNENVSVEGHRIVSGITHGTSQFEDKQSIMHLEKY